MSKMDKVYGEPKSNYTAKLRIKSGILMVWFIFLTVVCLLPLYLLIINSTHESSAIANGLHLLPGSYFFTNLKNVVSGEMKLYYDAFNGYKNSLIITCCSCAFTVFFSAMTAYGIHVYDFKVKEISYTAILLVMMIPMQVTSAGFVAFMNTMGLLNSYIPLIVPAIAAPAVVYFMRSYMKSSFPLDIVEAARIDGCSEFRTFVSIAIPMMKPAIAVQAIFAFIASWNNFYTPSMILVDGNVKKKTLPMMVQSLQTSDTLNDNGMKYMAIALSIIPIVIAYVCLSRFIIAGVALGGVKE